MTDADVTVKFDTRQAKQGERELDRAKGRSRRRQSRAASRRSRFGVGALAGAAAFRMVSRFRTVHAGGVDPWAESLVPVKAYAQEKVDAAVGSVTGSRAAVQDTKQRFALVEDEDQRRVLSRDYFKFTNDMRQREEGGRNIVRRTIVGPSVDELLTKATEGYLDLIEKSIEFMEEALK